MRKNLLVTILLVFGNILFGIAQEIRVKGNVADNSGPLAGASVVIKGTTVGVTTDFDGNYTIDAAQGAVLVISYVGMTPKEVVVSNAVINVVLETNNELDEVVVTGYSTKEKSKLTSAISTVDASQIEQVPMATFDNMLQGAAPGLLVQSGSGQPGSPANVILRGIKSISLSSEPVYIMDGQQISSDGFANINPNDIASISVLKDAAATQIYGSRGANGVIVITTKSGASGKTSIKYSTQGGVSIAPGYNKGVRPLTSSELIDLQLEIGIGPVNGLPQSRINALRKINEDWLDVTTRDGTTLSHELNISGGNENVRFFLSGSYFGQEGIALRSKLDRYALRSKVEYNKDRLYLGANIMMSYTDIDNSESEGSFGRNNPFYSSIRVPAYDLAIDPVTGGYAEPLDPTASSITNLLEYIQQQDENQRVSNAIVGLDGSYDFGFLKGLKFITHWSMDYAYRKGYDYVNPNSTYGRSRQGGKGRLDQSFRDEVSFTGTNSLRYAFDIGTAHQFNLGVYQEFVLNNDQQVGLEVYGLDQIKTISGATQGSDGNGFIPVFYGKTGKTTLSSYFGTLDYSYLNRYNLTAGIRRDGSSRFGENNRFGDFYSVGVGWVASEEKFLASSKVIDYLKLRASYGTVGNERINPLSSRQIYGVSSYNGQSGIIGQLSNPDLKWEQTAKTNIGVDLRMLKNRISLTADVYHEKTTDLFQNVPLSQTTGFGSQLRNVGSLKNEGIEFSINTTNIQTKNFRWDTGFNIASNKTTILKLNDGESFRNDMFLVEEGSQYPLFNLVKRAGVNPANGRFLWYDLNGNLTEVYDENNSVNVGRATPKYFGGFYTTFAYRGLELRATFTYSQGKELFNLARSSWDDPTKVSRGSVSNNALRFWRQPGDITDVPDPRQVNDYPSDSGWLEDASYIRLRNTVLSYKLPKRYANDINLAGLRVFLQGQNLITWTTFSGLDPENSSNIYVADYPSLKTISVGLDVNF